MDRERLGRVLGRGARHAAQTAFEAVDAAVSSAPTVRATPVRPNQTTSGQILQPQGSKPRARAPLLHAAKAAGSGFASPLRRASRALWQELTGCFFALFALSFGAGAWHTRADLHSVVPSDRHRLLAFGALSLLFLYFSVSSFVRARRISRSA